MSGIRPWLAAARLRTLPLSISGVLLGCALGHKDLSEPAYPLLSHPIFWLAMATTIGFQVLSNFANDYGDGVRGTDKYRKGEERMVASGAISPRAMKRAMIFTAVFTLFLASLLIFTAFGNSHFIWAFVFFNLGIASVIAAIKYTVGKGAYGYSGLGDVFVFLFFGLLSVLGSYFLFTIQWNSMMLLPAISIGCFSMAVLNLNNLRDRQTDAAAGKRTLVVSRGATWGIRYHTVILLIGMACGLGYMYGMGATGMQWFFLLSYVPFLLNIRTVLKHTEPAALDGELKKVAFSTFTFALLIAVAMQAW